MSGMLILQFLVLTFIISGVIIFALKKVLFDSTQGAVNRLNKETETVRIKQGELNQKIKEANEELEKRKKEAQELVQKMTLEAEEAAKAEREKIVNKAREEGEDIIAKANRTKDSIRKVIEKELEFKTIDYTVEILTEVLSEKAKGALNSQLNMEFLEKLEKVDMGLVAAGIDTAEVTTAGELEKLFREKLSQLIQDRLKRDIKIESKVDPQVVGGAILRFGNLTLDGSLRTAVRESGIALKERKEKGG